MNDIKTIIIDSSQFLINNNSFLVFLVLNSKVEVLNKSQFKHKGECTLLLPIHF